MKDLISYSDLLKIYRGSGNPKNSIWFVGMEWNGIDNEMLTNLNTFSHIEISNRFNGDTEEECTNTKNFFGILGLILKELGYEKDLIRKDKKTFININKDSNVFWTNTSLLGFKNSYDTKGHSKKLDEYKKYISGLNSYSYHKLFYVPEYLQIRKDVFKETLLQNPKFIFVAGNTINFYRYFTLIDADYNTKPLEKIEISYNAGKGKRSAVSIYNINNIKFVICPFFSSRWYNAKKDVLKICELIKNMLI